MLHIRSDKLKEGLEDFCKYICSKHVGKTLTIVEIGTWLGESTAIFAKYFGKVITIDPYNYDLLDEDMLKNDLGISTIQDVEKAFEEEVLMQFDNIVKIKDVSLNAAKHIDDKSVHIVYIDAKHEYLDVKADLKVWASKPTLYMAGHDYLPQKPGVIRAVDEYLGSQKPEMIFNDYSWINEIHDGDLCIARRGKGEKGLYDFCEYIKSKFDIKNMSLLEIGAYRGESTSIFAKYFGAVTTIDPWEVDGFEGYFREYDPSKVELDFDFNTKVYNNITKIKGFSWDVHTMFGDKEFDVIYIDGQHSGESVRKDISLYLPKAKLIIAGHDYGGADHEYDDLIAAVNELLGKPDKVFQDNSWIKELK